MEESPSDRELLLASYLAEAEEGLAAAEQDLVRLEAEPADDETLNRIFRVAHTLKGNSASLGLPVPAEFTHALEDLLDLVRTRRLEASGAVVTLLLQAMDVLKSMVPDAVADPAAPMRPAHRALMETLAGAADPEAEAEAGAPVAAAAAARPAAAGRTLRVPVERLDRMVNLGGEISIARGRLGSLLQRQPEGLAREALLDAQREVDGLFLELQEEIARVRTVPVAQMFRRFGRTVRDLAAAQGKRVRLVLEGEQLEVDTSVIELIADPLTHLVRNAVDHGIEPPEERRRKGKPSEGCITLRARRALGRVAIELSDDGRGLSRERILARAETLGRDAAALTDAELERLLFEPGFSTAERVSDISGRGIGLDVVRRNVEALRGTVSIAGREGAGTTVVIQLPLTLAVIRGFSVRVGAERFVVASDGVVECLDHAPGPEVAQASGVIALRGEAVPFLRLRHRFGVGGRPEARENVLVVRHGSARAGLAVDEVIGECEAVVKPLGRLLQGLPGLAGATILADGQVALILDEAALLSAAMAGLETAAAPPADPA